MEKKRREIFTLPNEIKRSKVLQEEIDSKQGEILVLQAKLQETKTALLDLQNPSKEKFEEQRKELELHKTKMKGYTDEKGACEREETNTGNF